MFSIVASLLFAFPPGVAPPSSLPGPGDSIKARVGSGGTKTTTTQTVTYSTRAPHGHTHTCPHCGKTWDHDSNSTHRCQFCGTAQYVQDRVARPVTIVLKAASSTSSAPLSSTIPAPAARPVARPASVVPRSVQGGCANGNCPLANFWR